MGIEEIDTPEFSKSGEHKLRILVHTVAPWIRCYDPETEFLTKLGWKRTPDVTLEDQVMTLNPETFIMEYQHPAELYSYHYRGKMYYLNSQFVNLLVTPEHGMFIAKRQRDNSWRWRIEDAITNKGKKVKYLKSGKWIGEEPKVFILPSVEMGQSVSGRGSQYAIHESGEREIPIEDFLDFMGFYLSEGYVDHSIPIGGDGYSTGNYTVAIRQNRPMLLEMGGALEKCTPNAVYYEGTKALVRDKQLWSYLLQFGYSHEKFVPDFIKELSPRLIKRFLIAYEKGDGNKDRITRRAIHTSSTRMRDDIQELCIKAGFASDYSMSAPAGRPGYFGVSKFDLWRISFHKHHGQPMVNKGVISDSLVDYDGMVHCVQVPNHILLVRRKGKTVFCCNSGYGNLCRHLTSRWKKAGFDPVVSCYYGCEPGGTLLINGVPCLPVERMGAPFGQDSYRHFYQTLKADIGILISDWWAFCLDEDTEILTRSGWKRHQEVEENEIVATFNMTTDLIEFQQIGGKFVYDNFKEVCSLKTKQLDLLVTPNHSLVYKCEKTLRTGGPWKKKEISNLRTSTIRYMPVSGKAKDLKPLGASQELMWLLGFIIAEGSFRDYDLRIYQSTKNESKLEKLRSSLKSLGIEFKEWVDERCREIKGYQTFPYIQFQIGAKYAKPLMARFSDPKKKIPREDILYCSDEEFQALLSGMVDGDGWKEKAGNGFQVMTKSERLRDFIQILCIFHGWRATFCQRENGCYLLTLSHNPYATFSGSHIKTESYSGKVWCVSTSNGTLIARRNGRHYIVGNSLIPDKNYSPRSAMYAPQDHVDYPEELVALTKRYDYVIALCKFQQDELAKNGIKAPVIEHGVETSVFAPMDKKKVREICKFSQDDFVIGIVAANCFDPKTEVLTKNGWKYFSEVSKEDLVLTLSQEGVMEYQNPTELIAQNYEGQMYRLKTKYLDFLVTPNHKMFVKKRVISKKIKRETGKTFRFTDFERVPVTEIYGKQRWYKKNGGTWVGSSPIEIILPSFRRERATVGKRVYQSKNDELPSISVPTVPMLRLIGYYVSEGSLNGNTTFIAQKPSEKKTFMLESLKELPFEVKDYGDKIALLDPRVSQYLKEFGISSHEKHLTAEIKDLSPVLLDELFNAMCLGDGWKTPSSKAYSTVSERLAGDVQEIILKMGDAGDICNSEKNSILPSGKPYHGRIFVVHRNIKVREVQNRPSSTKRPGNFIEEWVDYAGMVYCITVPNHVIYVRRNGKVAWSSQSDKETRKNFYGMFKAIRQFLDNNPDVKNIKVPYHGNPQDPRGIDLTRLAHNHNLDNILMFEDPRLSNVGLRDDEMAILYNNNDILLGASYREGFSLCHLESLSCGVPAIGTRFSAMPDLIGHNEERGWLADVAVLVQTPLLGYTSIPSVDSIERCIHRAYFHPEEIEKKGRLGREFALTLDWDRLVREKWVPFWSKVEDDIKPKPLSQRRLL